ncbi:MAG: DUF5036 family protein [Muribaculaceae bacterium]|nr:DUF5036 family protein [Muribaculaceae bacterium]
MKKILAPLFALSALLAVSCSNDDEPDIPNDAIALNLAVDDSRSTVGGSDVYINSSLNFTTSQCGIADFGRKGGLNRNPGLTQIAQEVAATPGNYYQVTLARDIRTVAGARAYPLNASYYNVYVDSWIYDKSNDISGAKISYTECFPQTDRLPGWDEDIAVSLVSGPYSQTATYTFPKGCAIDEDIDVYYIDGHYDFASNLEVVVEGNQIKFTNTAYTPDSKARAVVLVRHDSVYTRVNLIVGSPE